MLGAAIREEREQSAWTEGVAIWIAVIVVSGVGESSLHLCSSRKAEVDQITQHCCREYQCCPHAGAGNDYQKDLQFRKLNEKKDQLDVKMMRAGAQILVPNTQIVVGDVIILQTGDKITADGIVIACHNMVVDEASLTGESEPIKKGQKDPFCRAGTAVCIISSMTGQLAPDVRIVHLVTYAVVHNMLETLCLSACH